MISFNCLCVSDGIHRIQKRRTENETPAAHSGMHRGEEHYAAPSCKLRPGQEVRDGSERHFIGGQWAAIIHSASERA